MRAAIDPCLTKLAVVVLRLRQRARRADRENPAVIDIFSGRGLRYRPLLQIAVRTAGAHGSNDRHQSRAPAREKTAMADARRMGKMELFAHFAEKFDMKRTAVRDLFDELLRLSEKELKRSGEFVLPGMCKLVVQKRKAREGRNPATGEPIKIPAKTVVKARIAKQLKDAVLPRK
jgi:DNA-binding protein HU-beta